MKTKTTNKITELLKSGTPKQKAAIMCRNSELKGRGLSPLLTPQEERAILHSFQSEKGARAYNKWVEINTRLFEFSKIMLMAHYMYRTAANKLLGYLRVWEDYTREADRLNQLLIFMKNENPEKVEAFKEEVLFLAYRYGKMRLDDKGYFYIDIEGKGNLYEVIESTVAYCKREFANFKAYVVVSEKFIKEKKAEALIPILYEEALPIARQDLAAEVAPAYSRNILLRRIADGEKVTPEDRKKAVFPDFESTPADEDMIVMAGRMLYN